MEADQDKLTSPISLKWWGMNPLSVWWLCLLNKPECVKSVISTIWIAFVALATTCVYLCSPTALQVLDDDTAWPKSPCIMALSEVYWDRQIPLPKLAPVQAKATVALLALLCFINSYDGEFVFDDSEAIVNNKVLFSLFSIIFSFKNHWQVIHVYVHTCCVFSTKIQHYFFAYIFIHTHNT